MMQERITENRTQQYPLDILVEISRSTYSTFDYYKAGKLVEEGKVHSKNHLQNTKRKIMEKASIKELNHLLGNIDIYLFDQILKSRFDQAFKILDAGCGEGRNLNYFIKNDFNVWGIDKNADSIQMLNYLAKSINKEYPLDRFAVGSVEDMPYKNQEFDAIISSAVLHFAENKKHFLSMIQELQRVLKSGGILFARVATDVGMEDKFKPLGHGKFLLPDESVRFLLTKELLGEVMEDFGFEFIEPLKTVIVDDKRCMATLVLRKV